MSSTFIWSSTSLFDSDFAVGMLFGLEFGYGLDCEVGLGLACDSNEHIDVFLCSCQRCAGIRVRCMDFDVVRMSLLLS